MKKLLNSKYFEPTLFVVSGITTFIGIIGQADAKNYPAAFWAGSALLWLLACVLKEIRIRSLERIIENS